MMTSQKERLARIKSVFYDGWGLRSWVIVVLIVGLTALALFGLLYGIGSLHASENALNCEDLEEIMRGESERGLISSYARIGNLYEVKCK